ncbi:SAC3 family protein C [Linum perenne]
MQNINNNKAVSMYEKMVKFHVISHLKLRHCSNSPTTSSTQHLNMEQLTKAITTLYNLYDVNRGNSISVHKSEAEFRSLYVLLHMDSRNQPTGESLALWFRRIPQSVIRCKEMCFARRVLRSYRLGNYKHFLSSIAAEASYLQYCILEPYINEVRAFSLSCINSVCYKLHPYPLDRLSNVLMMKEAYVELVCNGCGLETFTDETGNKWLPTKQATFACPKDSQSFPVLGLEPFEQ